jgi:hypothetical protein
MRGEFMNIRERFIEILGKYWWVLLIIVAIGYFFTDIPIFKYIIYVIAIPFALMIFLPFIIQLFSPAFVLVSSLIEHFREAKSMPFGKKYIFVPMSLVSAISFLTAQMILSIWVFILSFVIWDSVIGFFWTFFLSFLFGLAPVVIITAPFLAWYKEGFALFLGTGIFFLITLFWFGFSKLAFSEDYYSLTPENYLGYSPQFFLLGALSFQVIALPFYRISSSIESLPLLWIANLISAIGGLIFLILALTASIKWIKAKRKLSDKEKAALYRPSLWVYVLGFLVTYLFSMMPEYQAPLGTIAILNIIFLVALIGRFFGLFRRKPKVQKVEYDSEDEY